MPLLSNAEITYSVASAVSLCFIPALLEGLHPGQQCWPESVQLLKAGTSSLGHVALSSLTGPQPDPVTLYISVASLTKQE